MKNLIRKGVAALLALAMLCTATVFAVNFEAPADAVSTDYEDAARMLTTLGIMTVAEDGSFLGNEPVTRAEFAQIIVRLLGLSSISRDASGQTVETVEDDWEGSGISTGVVVQVPQFNDVPFDHWAYSFIEVVAGLSFMSGDENNNFMPDDYIMYQDALVVLLKVLGYGVYAEYEGGYPNGYLAIASQNGLQVDDANPTAAITKGQLANLIVDSFEVDINVQVGFGEDKTYERREDHTILTEFLDIEKARGIVTGTELTGMQSALEKADAGSIRIDNTKYITNDLDTSDLLGQRLTYYYTEDDGIYTLVYYESAPQDNREVAFQAEDFINYEGSRLSYYTEDGAERSVTVPQTAPVILNEVYVDIAQNVDFDSYREFAGDFRTLDSDGDGRADVVFVHSYQTYLVKSVNADEMKLYVRDVTKEETISTTADNSQFAPLDLSQDNVIVRLYRDGASIEINAITANNVLSVGKSENAEGDIVYTIYVSSRTARGTLSEINQDEATIGENTYPILPNAALGVQAGSNGTFYIDTFGNLVAFTESEGDYAYAYLIGAALEGQLSKTLHLRMFTQRNQTVESFSVSDEIQLISQEERNGEMEYGTSKKTPEEIFDALAIDPNADPVVTDRQMVAYRTDTDGNLISLCLARVYNDWQNTDASIIPQQHPVGILSTLTNADGTDGPGFPKTRTAYREQFTDFSPAASAPIFDLRSQYTDEWTIVSREEFRSTNSTIDNVSAYNIGSAAVAGIVLIEPDPETEIIVGGNPQGLQGPSRLSGRYAFVVSDVYTSLNANQEEVMTIHGFENGTELTYTIDVSLVEDDRRKATDEDDTTIPIGFYNIQIGDVWILDGNPAGELTIAKRLFSAAEQNWTAVATYHRDIPASYNGECDVALGFVREVGENALLIAVDEATASMATGKELWAARVNLYSENDTRVTIYDVENETVTQGTFSNVMVNDLIYTYSTDSTMRALMIIRNYED